LLIIAEVPNEMMGTAAIVSPAKAGNLQTSTMRAFTADEMREILAKVF
jgi:uncharacterized protein with GYD domain